MSERQVALILLLLCTHIATAVVAYMLGKVKGLDDALGDRKALLGVGSVWKLGEDGRLHKVSEGDGS